MSERRALVIGITGQVGSMLSEVLLLKGYSVHGTYRRTAHDNLKNIRNNLHHLVLHRADLCDPQSIDRVLREVKPTHLFNEADQDNVDWSFSTPAYSADVTFSAVVRLLESVRVIDREIRVFQPVSALMFGDSPPPQDEHSPLNPLSPYAVCKTAAFHACRSYRQTHGIFVSTGIMFNHTSTRRNGEYLLHRICRDAVDVVDGRKDAIVVGSPEMRIDIGCAREYAEASLKILEHPIPDDFVIGTGCGWSIREMCQEALKVAGVVGDLSRYVREDVSLLRPGPQPTLIADVKKARDVLKWQAKVGVGEIIKRFVDHFRERGTL